MLNFNLNEDFVSSACWMDEFRSDGFDTFVKWHNRLEPYIPNNDISVTYDELQDNSVSIVLNTMKSLSIAKPVT